MTKRGTLGVMLLVLVAMLALGAPSAMALQPLTAKQAKDLAKQLGKKQKRENDVVVYHVEDRHRVDAFTITFAYDERTSYKAFCTAVVRVHKKQAGNRILTTAKLTRHRCKQIPGDALAIERATRKADKRIRANEKTTLRSVRRVLRSTERCEELKVPRRRRFAAGAVIDIAINGALARPNQGTLDALVASLGRVQSSNDVVVRAVEGWADYDDVLASLPVIKDPCGALRNWAKSGWSAQQAPIDVDEYRAFVRRGKADTKAIAAGARYLLASGVYRKLVLAFTPDGLLTRFASE
jgi:hypothetical protein